MPEIRGWLFVGAGAWIVGAAGCSATDIGQALEVDDARAGADSGGRTSARGSESGASHSAGGGASGSTGSGGVTQPSGFGGSNASSSGGTSSSGGASGGAPSSGGTSSSGGASGGAPPSGGSGTSPSGGTSGADAGSPADASTVVDASRQDVGAAGGSNATDASMDGSDAFIVLDASTDSSDGHRVPPVDAGPVVACTPFPAKGPPGGTDSGVDGGAPDGGVHCPLTQSNFPGLWSRVCPDKSHYAIGETVTLTYTVENTGTSDVTLTVDGQCDLESGITVSAVGPVFCQCDVGDCFPSTHPLTIAAGGAFVDTVTWDQRIYFGASDTGQRPASQVPPGTYTVQGRLFTQETFASASSAFTIGTPSTSDGGMPNLFGSPSSYRAGTNTQSLALGDLDGNATLDLAIAQANASSVVVMRGVGDGTFGCPASFHVDTGSQSLVLSDLDRDGRLDIAAAISYGAGGLALLHGAGDATFTPATNTTAGFQPWTVASGDLNHDGKPDLIVGNDGAAVSVLIGRGDMSFAPAVQYDSFGNSVGAVALGDLNGDKNLDIVAVETWSLAVLLGDGTGVFGTPRHFGNFAQPEYIKSFALADFNADGKLDLALPMSGSVASTNVLAVWFGNGDGTFSPHASYDTGWGIPSAAVVADFNADGQRDIAVANSRSSVSDGYVALLLGDGTGAFQKGGEYPVPSPVFVNTADLNGDKKPDLVVANDWDFVSVLLNASP